MVHICNFCPGKVFKKNVLLMFHKFGDDITVYVRYDGISENYSCRSFRFEGCKFFDSYLGLDTFTVFSLTCRATDRIFVLITLVFLTIYFFILYYFKTVEGCKVVKIFIARCFEFCNFFWCDEFFSLITIVNTFILEIFVTIF